MAFSDSDSDICLNTSGIWLMNGSVGGLFTRVRDPRCAWSNDLNQASADRA